MKVTENFTLKEFTASQTAVRLNVEEQFSPSNAIVDNLKKLSTHILEPLREILGKPITITSGYRSKRLNKLIGGAVTSQHMEGKAVDIRVAGFTTEELFQEILKTDLPFDQLIQEFDSWIHVSFDDKKNRREALRAVKKGRRTQYSKA
jgi:zinc D-Ala-D-Ala carboxypeptidase